EVVELSFLHSIYCHVRHKCTYDYVHFHTDEPITMLVNQGMILGEMEYTAYRHGGLWQSATKEVPSGWEAMRLDEDQVEKQGDGFVLKDNPKIRIDARAYKMTTSRCNTINTTR